MIVGDNVLYHSIVADNGDKGQFDSGTGTGFNLSIGLILLPRAIKWEYP